MKRVSTKSPGASVNARRTSEAKPFRQTMMQFEDDPAEINRDTKMDGIVQSRNAEPLLMADRLDMI